MADSINGDGSTSNFDRKLDRINDAIANLTSGVIERERVIRMQFELSQKQHELVMEELREMRDLQREQRIDILALFEVSKRTKERLERLEEGS